MTPRVHRQGKGRLITKHLLVHARCDLLSAMLSCSARLSTRGLNQESLEPLGKQSLQPHVVVRAPGRIVYQAGAALRGA